MRCAAAGMPTSSSQPMALLARLGVGQAHMGLHGLDQLAADRIERVERGQRVLEDRADLLAADPAHRLVRQVVDALAVEADLAAGDAAGRLQQADDGAPVSDLPAPDSPTTPSTSPASMANETSSSARSDAAAGREFDGQVLDGRAAPSAQPRVQRVAQPVAQQVDRQHHQHQGDAGEDRHPPLAGEQEVVADPDQRAERRLGRRQADAEERQRRLGRAPPGRVRACRSPAPGR